MKTLLIFIVLLAITGCAITPAYDANAERKRIMEQARIDRDAGIITIDQYLKIQSDIIHSMPYYSDADIAATAAQAESSRVLMETGARLLGGGGYGYGQPARLQTTCTQMGMFTQCW